MPSESGQREQAESFTGSAQLKDTGSTAVCSAPRAEEGSVMPSWDLNNFAPAAQNA